MYDEPKYPSDLKTNPKTLRRNTDPFTSHDAAEKVDTNRMESIVYGVIDSFGETGCISDQVQYALPEYRYSTITARYKPLKDKGLVMIDGRTIKGESGRSQLRMWSARHFLHETITEEDIYQSLAEAKAGI